MAISVLCFLFKVSYASDTFKDVRGEGWPSLLVWNLFLPLAVAERLLYSWFKDPSEVVCFSRAQRMTNLTPGHSCQPKTWFIDSAYVDFPSFQYRHCMGQAGGTLTDRISAAWSTSAPLTVVLLESAAATPFLSLNCRKVKSWVQSIFLLFGGREEQKEMQQGICFMGKCFESL